VCDDEKTDVLDLDGNKLLEIDSKYAVSSENGLIYYYEETENFDDWDHTTVMDINKNVIIENVKELFVGTNEVSLVRSSTDGNVYCIYNDGKISKIGDYTDVSLINRERVIGKRNNRWYVMNFDGSIINSFEAEKIVNSCDGDGNVPGGVSDYQMNLNVVITQNENGKYCVYSANEEKCLLTELTFAKEIEDGYFLACSEEGDAVYKSTKTGIEKTLSGNNFFLAAYLNGVTGIIYKDGSVKFFDISGKLLNDAGKVKLEKYTYFSGRKEDGSFAQCFYIEAYEDDLSAGTHYVYDSTGKLIEGGLNTPIALCKNSIIYNYKIFDLNKKLLLEYDSYNSTLMEKYITCNANKSSIVSYDGYYIVEPGIIEKFGWDETNEYIALKVNGKWGVYKLTEKDKAKNPLVVKKSEDKKQEETTTAAKNVETTKANNLVPEKIGQVKKLKVNSPKRRVLVVKYKAVKNAKKYQIQYSTSRKFKKKVSNKTTSKIKCTIKKLKSKKKYYIRVRAINGANKGKWSSIKKITIK